MSKTDMYGLQNIKTGEWLLNKADNNRSILLFRYRENAECFSERHGCNNDFEIRPYHEDVDFAPVIHAKWIDGYTHEHLKVNSKGFVCAGIFGCNCSNCGGYVTASDEYAVHGSFCPNCGADMRGENDE